MKKIYFFTFFILLVSNYLSAKRMIIDSYELDNVKKFYYESDTTNWYSNELSLLYNNKIYESKKYIEYRCLNIGFVFDRDTVINNEIIEICKFRKLDFKGLITSNENTILGVVRDSLKFKGKYNRLEELSFRGLKEFSISDEFEAKNLKIISLSDINFIENYNYNKFRNLEELEYNNISSNIDVDYINLPQCRKFKIQDCAINSNLRIINLEYIEEFILKGNEENKINFREINKDFFNHLKNIKTLNISNSNFNWDADTLYFQNAEKIILSNNELNDNMPIIKANNLEYLDLRMNNYTGQLPDINLEKLIYLNLSNNKLEGKINKEIINNLEYLNLCNNNLNGELDFNIDFKNLIYINLSHNNLIGEIPEIKGSKLLKVDLSYNLFRNFNKEINVNKNTILKLNNNNIIMTEIVKRCSDYLEENEDEYNTNPKHILSYSLHEMFDSNYTKYYDEELFLKHIENDLTQNIHETVYISNNSGTFELIDKNENLFNYYGVYSRFEYYKTIYYKIDLNNTFTNINIGKLYAESKYCNNIIFEFKSKEIELNVDYNNKDCSEYIEINYYDLMGRVINKNDIYNKQIIVQYRCIETGEIINKLEIRER